MKYITLLFTTIFFLAFAEAQAAVDIEPAFPTWVESGLDPPDAALFASEHQNILTNVVMENPDYFTGTQSTQPADASVLPYRCFTAAGGVGRLCSVFCLVFIPNPAVHNNTLNVLNGTSGGMGRIREANYLAALVNV